MKDWETLQPDATYWMRKHYMPGRAGRKIEKIVIHHNAANLSLRQIYDVWQVRQASAHYQVDAAGRVGQYVRLTDTAWAVGGGMNSSTISIEHANNRFAPAWTVSDATLENGAHLVAALCHHYQLGPPRWGINVFPHQAFYPTACPGALAGSQNAAYMARARYWYEQMVTGRSAPPGRSLNRRSSGLVNNPNSEESEMNTGLYWNEDPKTIIYAICNPDSGFWIQWSNGANRGPMPGSYNNEMARAFRTGSFVKLTKSHAMGIKKSCELVREGAGLLTQGAGK